MSAAGRWFITPHAVDRYRSRVALGLTYEQALGEIVRASTTAHLVKVVDGVEHWRCGRAEGNIRFRVGAPRPEHGTLPVLLKVLPAFSGCRPRRVS